MTDKMAVKPTKSTDYKEVTYATECWQLLNELRSKAAEIMSGLEVFHLKSIVHGSVARGDVNKNSDVDVFIPEVQNSFLVEIALEEAGIKANNRLIVQATPTYAMKAHIEVDERTSISFPLMPMRRVEREFYWFGGEININQLKAHVRVPGVDKRLMLIEPTKKGHIESNIIGKEEVAAKILGISAETALDRVHTLLKRDIVGRTGVFVKRELSLDETFELALKKLSEINPAVRRRMKK
jgi:predicted nucleotidyltransferase